MHLVFEEHSGVFLGSVQEENGCLREAFLTDVGQKVLGPLWQEWRKEGIRFWSLFRRGDRVGGTTSARLEFIPMNSSRAFSVFVATLPKYGFVVCSLDSVRALYWDQLSRWPISDRLMFDLVQGLRNFPNKDMPSLRTQWQQLALSMEHISQKV